MLLADLQQLHALPFFELLQKARAVHEANWPDKEVQLCTLLSIKTGGCPEDCGYCSQSAHADSGLKAEKLMDVEAVLAELPAQAGVDIPTLLERDRAAREAVRRVLRRAC